MQKAMTKNEFMTQYINDKYKKRYEERRKISESESFLIERGIKAGKAYSKNKIVRR